MRPALPLQPPHRHGSFHLHIAEIVFKIVEGKKKLKYIYMYTHTKINLVTVIGFTSIVR